MRVIIAGSRSIDSYELLLEAVAKSGFSITEVVSGNARGADWLGEHWAAQHGVKLTLFSPQWYRDGHYNPRGGFERNIRMAVYAEALIALWDGKSRGTAHMISEATSHGLKIYVALLSKGL